MSFIIGILIYSRSKVYFELFLSGEVVTTKPGKATEPNELVNPVTSRTKDTGNIMEIS